MFFKSEPACGSVNARAASFPSPLAAGGKNFSFCASVPKFAIGAVPNPLWAEIARAVPPSPQASSSIAMAALIESIYMPP